MDGCTAFDFVALPREYKSCWGLLCSEKSLDAGCAKVLCIDQCQPNIGFTSLGEFVCLDQGRLKYEKSVMRLFPTVESPSTCVLDSDRITDESSDDSGAEESPTSEFLTAAKAHPLLSRQLTATRSNGKPEIPGKEDEIEHPSSENEPGQNGQAIYHTVQNDISSLMHKRVLQGYGMDAVLNRDIVVDSSLQVVWTWLAWSSQASSLGKLSASGLDFTFEGCLNIWKGIAGNPTKPLPPYDDVYLDAIDAINTKFPSDIFPEDITDAPLRQLALSSTGWCLTNAEHDRFQIQLINDGKYDKAAFYVLVHTRNTDQVARVMELGGVNMSSAILDYIAAHGDDEAKREWWNSCEARGVDLDSPYIRAIFSYLSAYDWRDVIDEQGLSLRERMALAIRYVRDEELTSILHDLCRTEVAEGNLEGLLLTGINAESLDLLQAYINRTADLQTAVLIVTNKADLSDDPRVVQWVSDYRALLKSWGLHLERCRFDVARNKITRKAKHTINTPRQICMRCNQCNSIIISDDGLAHISGKLNEQRSTPSSKHSGPIVKPTLCTVCKKSLPRCLLCLIPIGNERLLSFCLSCNHALHKTHAAQWFSDHEACPAPDCACLCRSR